MLRKAISVLLVISILSFGGIASAAAPIQDRFYTFFNTSVYNTTDMQYRMNCYGYAVRFYYEGSLASIGEYKQQPGEFTVNSEPYSGLNDSYINAATVWNNMYYFVKDRVFEDFSSLGWTITETTSTAQASSGTRKILLTICQDGWDSDYHFYVQNSNGTWCHKQGDNPISNLSIDTQQTITNSNILSMATQGGYDDGIRIFVLGKDSILDYGHNYGQDANTTYTTTDFRDKAGDTITRCTAVSAGNKNCRFDYSGDIDFYKFTPTTTKIYTIKTSCGTGYDVDGDVFDSNGNIIATDSSANNASFNVNLVAGTTYYIDFRDYIKNVANYTLQIS